GTPLCSSHCLTRTLIHPLPLRDALPIFGVLRKTGGGKRDRTADLLHAMQALSQLSYTPGVECLAKKRDYARKFLSVQVGPLQPQDRKSTRLNSSHVKTSYAVCCLKKKKR